MMSNAIGSKFCLIDWVSFALFIQIWTFAAASRHVTSRHANRVDAIVVGAENPETLTCFFLLKYGHKLHAGTYERKSERERKLRREHGQPCARQRIRGMRETSSWAWACSHLREYSSNNRTVGSRAWRNYLTTCVTLTCENESQKFDMSRTEKVLEKRDRFSQPLFCCEMIRNVDGLTRVCHQRDLWRSWPFSR